MALVALAAPAPRWPPARSARRHQRHPLRRHPAAERQLERRRRPQHGRAARACSSTARASSSTASIRTTPAAFNFTAPSPSCYGLSYDALVGALAAARHDAAADPDQLHGSHARSRRPPTAPAAARRSPSSPPSRPRRSRATGRPAPSGRPAAARRTRSQAWEIWNEENNGYWWGGDRLGDAVRGRVLGDARRAAQRRPAGARRSSAASRSTPHGQPSFMPPSADDPDARRRQRERVRRGRRPSLHRRHRRDLERSSPSDAIALINSVAAQLVASTGPGPGGAPRQQIWVTEMGWSDQQEPIRARSRPDCRRSSRCSERRRARRTTSGRCSGTTCATTPRSASRDDQLGLRYTNSDGSDAGPKPAWGVFAAARGAGRNAAAAGGARRQRPLHRARPDRINLLRLGAGRSGTGLGASGPRGRVRRLGRPRARREGQGHGQTAVCHVVIRHGHHVRVCGKAKAKAKHNRQRASDASAA